ncbi:MAG TPA: type II toxin-antitoxin system RelE/ParE family toxin [Candidatus Binataceae bacterium]|nr:type II toxin-antitoxin system RelE/ParE family toxin [Candidatus Binataceae bacterium]
MIVRWTTPAADDLTRICDYTREHFGPAQARRAALGIYQGAESIKTHPNRGRRGRNSTTRELIVSGLPFLIVYRVRGKAIEVVRILHSRQKWP